jgi:hypothetical protein
MSWTLPARPAWARKLNTIGRNLGGPERLVSLEEASLYEAATAATGLDDFGDDGFRPVLTRLVRALTDEARLNTVGRLIARSEIVRLLQNRLRVEETFKRHPEIGAEAISEPVFITGTGRSGTSILHELMTLDPAHRVPRTWEALYSCPPPQSATYDDDPRIALADAEMTFWDEVVPAYRTMHENGGALPQEDIFLMAHEFMSAHFLGCYDVPTYAGWMVSTDIRPAYRYQRRMMQLLQWKHGGKRWVLKAPSHLSTLRELLDVFPDALIVLTHRDPLRVIGSITSLIATLRWMRSDDVDYVSLLEWIPLGTAMSLDAVRRHRGTGELPEDRFVDLLYSDLVADPVTAVRTTYAKLGSTFDDATAARVRSYLERKPQGKHGAHRYDFAQTGLDMNVERERFAAYTQHYRVPDEVGPDGANAQ